jgi:histidyl-tRNA synthetase
VKTNVHQEREGIPLAEKKQFRAIKGTRDILPPDSARWNWFEQTAREVFRSYNFGEIRLPIFEETELFARSVGADTDIIGKEMFGVLGGGPFSVEEFQEELRSVDLRSLESRLEANLSAYPEFRSQASQKFLAALSARSGTAAQLFGDFERSINDDAPLYLLIADCLDQVGSPIATSLSLRPEATASVCRAYIEHGMHRQPGNVKLYYMGSMFRRERPQKGRYRQFDQIGAEVLGQSDAPAIDAEVIEMLLAFFARVGLGSTILYINSIGDKNCRPPYVELLREELRKVKDRLAPDSRRRIETNPLRVLDSKLPEEQAVIEELPRMGDHLCRECGEHFARLKDELKLRGVPYEENWRLVRGLDYYTRTTFEVTAAGLGSQNAVCGGGRYDGLIELLGGPPTKGIGFAIGTDRAILSIQESKNLPPLPARAVFVAWMSEKAYPTAVGIAKKLRHCGLSVELPPEEMKLKKSLGLADKLGARYALIIGDEEVASGAYALKRLADGEQKKFSENDLLEYLESERRGTGA